MAATATAAALRHLHGARPGPVHVNCQFRDPLGPVGAAWNPDTDLKGLSGWDRSRAAFTAGGGSFAAGPSEEEGGVSGGIGGGWDGTVEGEGGVSVGGGGDGVGDAGGRVDQGRFVSSSYSSSSSFGVGAGYAAGGPGVGVFGELAAVIRSARRGLLVVAGGGDRNDQGIDQRLDRPR